MADPYLGEIRIFSFPLLPRNWAACDGAALPIAQNVLLYSLLGTTFGGDGVKTFALPDMRGRVPVGAGARWFVLGQRGGEAAHTLVNPEMPEHAHLVFASPADGDLPVPGKTVLARTVNNIYSNDASSLTPISPLTVANAGESQPHNNMAPFLTLQWCISLTGPLPPRSGIA